MINLAGLPHFSPAFLSLEFVMMQNSKFRFAVCALGLSMTSLPVLAQSAPIRMGNPSSAYTQQDNTQAQISRQIARMGELEAQLSQLTGRIETLEYRLGQAEADREELAEDNRDLRDRMAELEKRLENQSTRNVTSQSSREPSPLGSDRAGNGAVWTNGSGASNREENSGPRNLTPGANSANTSDTSSAGSSGRLPEGTLGTIPAAALPGNAGALFELGKSRLISFDYEGAEVAFREFLNEFGDDPQAGEAYYWLGEALYQQEDYAGSARFLTTMVQDYTDDPRRGEALVKLARSLRELGETGRACAFLQRLGDVDPNASTATRERAQLEMQRSSCR